MSKLIERDGKYFIEVGANDSYGSIAYEHTGDSSRWRELTKCNEVDVTRPVVAGLLLRMPDQWAEERSAGKWAGAPELSGAPDPSPAPVRSVSSAEPAAHSGSPPLFSRDELIAAIKEVIAPWSARADRTIGELQDQVKLLEMKRDQDEKRLAEQGGKIASLEARLATLSTVPPPPVVTEGTASIGEPPNRTGASGGAG